MHRYERDFSYITVFADLVLQTQIRHGIQTLRQLQDQKLSDAHIARRDIATLLKQNNILLARAKAQKLLKEESVCEVLDIVDSYCTFILDHYKELEKR